MNIFGVGGMEFVLVIIIMLVIAGPKRMVRWAYIAGQYTAKLRTMWDETVSYLQKEFDAAGLDIEVPKNPPTKKDMNKAINSALDPVTKPVSDAMGEIEETRKSFAVNDRSVARNPGNGHKNAPQTQTAADQSGDSASENGGGSNYGTWAGQTPSKSSPDAETNPETRSGEQGDQEN